MIQADRVGAGGALEPASAPWQQAAVGPAEKTERTWGMFCHLLALAGFVGIPYGNIIGPLVMWLVKKNESEFVANQGKESLNFQITMTIAFIASALLMMLVSVPTYADFGILLLIAVCIFNVVMIIHASTKANAGIRYRYPICLRLIK